MIIINLYGKYNKSLPVEEKAESFKNSFYAATTDGYLSVFAQIDDDIHAYEQDSIFLKMRLHPCENFIYVEITDDNIYVATETGYTGPGYHAYFVDVLYDIAASEDIEFYWDGCTLDDTDLCGDESGYAFEKNFSKLQARCADYLHDMSEIILTYEKTVNLIPYDIPLPVDEYFAATVTGIRAKEYFIEIVNSSDKLKSAENHFVWWNKKWDNTTYIKTANSIMWCLVPWRKPLEHELILYDSILGFLREAYESDPTLSYPWSEWLELAQLADNDYEYMYVQQSAPEKLGAATAGYMRNAVVLSIENWSISIPGKYYMEYDEDGAIILTYDKHNLSIVLSISKFDVKFTAKEFLNDMRNDLDENEGEPFEFEKTNSVSLVYLSDDEEEDELILSGAVTADGGNVLLLTITVPAGEEENALKIWHSITFNSVV